MFKLRQKRAPRVLPQQKWRRKKGLQFWIGLLSIDVMIDLIFVQDQTPNRRISRIPWLSLEIFNLIPNLSNPTRVAWWNWLPYELGVVLIFSAPWKINECPPQKKKQGTSSKRKTKGSSSNHYFFSWHSLVFWDHLIFTHLRSLTARPQHWWLEGKPFLLGSKQPFAGGDFC